MHRTLILSLLAVFLAPPAHAGGSTGTLRGKVIVKHQGETIDANVVVYLEPIGGTPRRPRRRAKRESPKISQKGREFRPRFTVVDTDTVVEFPNDDNDAHNVYAKRVSHKRNWFDFGTYRRGTTKRKRFKQADVIEVRCNRHPKMSATILVLDRDFWVRTNADGSWTLAGVPPGTYDLVAWVPFSAKHRERIVVKPGNNAVKPFTLKEGKLPPRTRKDGTPHPYYRP